ncbi:MAG TPA: hypothetical protein VGQ83_18800 [Polyangia bacterium]|jgi:hypothetical protein
MIESVRGASYRHTGRLTYATLAICAVLLGAGCGAGPQAPVATGPGPAAAPCPGGGGKRVALTGEDDEVGAAKLGAFLRENGYQVIQQQKGFVKVQYKGMMLFLMPKIYAAPNRVDRVVITRFFGPKDEMRGKPEMRELATMLNDKLNVAQFRIDSDGDLAVTGSLTFMDDLTLDLIEGYFNWMQGFVPLMLQTVPEVRTYLK